MPVVLGGDRIGEVEAKQSEKEKKQRCPGWGFPVRGIPVVEVERKLPCGLDVD